MANLDLNSMVKLRSSIYTPGLFMPVKVGRNGWEKDHFIKINDISKKIYTFEYRTPFKIPYLDISDIMVETEFSDVITGNIKKEQDTQTYFKNIKNHKAENAVFAHFSNVDGVLDSGAFNPGIHEEIYNDMYVTKKSLRGSILAYHYEGIKDRSEIRILLPSCFIVKDRRFGHLEDADGTLYIPINIYEIPKPELDWAEI